MEYPARGRVGRVGLRSQRSRETFFHPLNGTEHGSPPSLTTRDRELVSVLEVRIEPGDSPGSKITGFDSYF